MTAKEKNIVCYSLKRKPKRGRTDVKRVLATTNEEIERDAAGDPDVALPQAGWFADARAVFPIAKMPVSIRIDADVLEFFRKSGPGLANPDERCAAPVHGAGAQRAKAPVTETAGLVWREF